MSEMIWQSLFSQHGTVLLIKHIKDNLTRRGMQNTRALHGKERMGKKERVLLSERTHCGTQVLTVKKNMHLILNNSAACPEEHLPQWPFPPYQTEILLPEDVHANKICSRTS